MARGELVIITGVSGSGKSTALKAFEDTGFRCVDNLPIPLIDHFADFVLQECSRDGESTATGGAGEALSRRSAEMPRRFALLIDCREDDFYPRMRDAVERLQRGGVQVSIWFFDCSDEVVIRRFRETRRPHPLLSSGSLMKTISEALARERELLADVRQAAARIIDTSASTVHDLRRMVEQYCGRENTLEVFLTSFGYKYGAPYEADLLLDVRFLPNPHFVTELKPMTGLEQSVADYVFATKDAHEVLERYADLLSFLIPRYQAEGKRYLTVGIGCTGGKHRSVAICERLEQELSQRGVKSLVVHRDLERDGSTSLPSAKA